MWLVVKDFSKLKCYLFNYSDNFVVNDVDDNFSNLDNLYI